MEVRAAFAALLVFALNASAATNNFSAIGPDGGIVNRIVYSQDGTTAFMGAVGGFYRSQDGGISWKSIKSDLQNAPIDVVIDPSDASRIYVVVPSAPCPCLYLSSDGGATITASATLPTAVTQARALAVSHDGTTLFLAGNGQIFRSTDRGQSWQARTALSADDTTQVLRLVVDPTDAATLYAAVATGTTASAGIFVTRDGAATWQQVTSGSQSMSLVVDLAIDPSNPAKLWSAQYDGIWVSADHGTHWSNALSEAMYAVAVDPTNPSLIYATTPYGKVYRSSNAGTSWVDVSDDITAGENPTLAINPAHPTQLLVGGYAGVAGSANSGSTWSPQQSGFRAVEISGLSADVSADRLFIQARANGVFYTGAGGSTVQPVNNPSLLALEAPQPVIDVTAVLAQPGRLFASVATGITSSTDGGASWGPVVEVLPGQPSQQAWALSSQPSAPQIILASTNGPLVRSSNRGASWSQVGNGIPANAVAFNVMFAPSDPASAYATLYVPTVNANTMLGVYKSLDAGVSWAPVNNNLAASPTYLMAVDPSDPKIAYGNNINIGVTPSASVLKTTDGGAHWSAISWDNASSNGTASVLAVDPLHPAILYAASFGRVARSVDGGASWETLRGKVVPYWLVNALLPDPHRPENLLVGTNNSSVQQITISPDMRLDVSGPPAQIGVGATASYTYTATNLGPFDATGVTVAVQLPTSAQSVVATVGSGTGHCTVSATVATCVFSIVRKAANAMFTVTAMAPDAGAFDATATVSGEQPDPDLSNNTVSATTTATLQADLSVTASGGGSAVVGDTVNYTLVAGNAGPNPATAAVLTLQLGAGLTLGTVSSPNATCTTSAGTASCDLGTLAASGTATFTVTATAASAGTQTLTAAVSSSTSDPTPGNNSASASTDVGAVVTTTTIASPKGGGGALSVIELLALASLLRARRPKRRLPMP